MVVIVCGCLIALITYGLRTSFGLFVDPLMFGTRYMGTLFGFVFLSHQVGAFLGVWLGGVAFEQTGSYAPVWWASVFLGVLAAALH